MRVKLGLACGTAPGAAAARLRRRGSGEVCTAWARLDCTAWARRRCSTVRARARRRCSTARARLWLRAAAVARRLGDSARTTSTVARKEKEDGSRSNRTVKKGEIRFSCDDRMRWSNDRTRWRQRPVTFQ
jgi:hypothetical protein